MWAVFGGAVAVLVTAYALLPIGVFGPQRPVLSWTVFFATLAVLGFSLLKYVRDVLLDRPGTRPGLAIALLMCVTVLVFSAAYLALARQPGGFDGLRTRLDALYFTLVTLATVGYGDVSPKGQGARLVAILQIVFNLVFLTAAATALSQRFRAQVARDAGPEEGPGPERPGPEHLEPPDNSGSPDGR